MSLELPPRRLVECEIVIKRGLSTFIEVGNALLEIRDARLYLETHGSFEDYCRERWGMSRTFAYDTMASAQKVSAIADIRPELPQPSSEGIARELPGEPERAAEAWGDVVEIHGEKPTAAQVREVVDTKRNGSHVNTTQCLRCKSRVRLDRPHKCPGAHHQLEEARKLLQRAYEDMCNHPGAVADLPGCLDLAEKCERLAGRVRVRLQDDAESDEHQQRLGSTQRTIEGVGFAVCECGSRIADFKDRPYCFGCKSYRDGGQA